MFHSVLAFLLSITLAWAPVTPARGPEPLGQLNAEGIAEVNGVVVPRGTTLFAGDRISTRVASVATASLAGGNHILVTENSLVQLQRRSAQVGVTVERGTVGLVHREGAPVMVQAAGLLIRPASSTRVTYLAKLEQDAVVLTAVRGEVRVEGRNAAYTVAEGKSMRFTLAEGPQGPQGAGASSFAGNALIVTAIVLAAAAAIVIPVVLSNLDNEPVSP